MGRHLIEGAGAALCQRLGRIGLHDHACLVLDSEDQRLEIATAFLQVGLQRGERCVYVADENTAGRIMAYLRAAGTDPGRALASGSLVVTTDGGTCLRPGSIDPGDIFGSLESQIEAALADGFRALRIMGEATWALGRTTKLERLADYEERLKRTFRDQPIVALWLYDPWKCPPGLVRSFLRMHPLVVVRGDVYRNCLFVPAVRRPAARGRHDEWQPTLDVIVERARAEDDVARRLEQLHLALDGGAHALWGWDLESDRISLDAQFAEMPGIERSRAAVTLSEWEQVVHPDALGSVWKSARDHLEGHTPQLDHEIRMRDRSGSWRWVHLRGRVVRRDASGRPVRIAGTATDVTEQRAARERLASREQLAAADRLATSVAREIDGPLAEVTAGLGYAKELLERLHRADAAIDPAARVLEVVEETRKGAARIRDAVDELPAVFRAPASGTAVPCDVRKELLDALNAASEEIALRARASASLPETLPRVLAPHRALGRVFLGLLLDAARAIPEGSPEENEVRVAARSLGEEVVVEVTDTGAGVSPQARQRMLDVSFTAHARRAAGIGVGLSLCRAIAWTCGGRVDVESDPARGTTVRVVLPAMQEDLRRADARPPPDETRSAGARPPPDETSPPDETLSAGARPPPDETSPPDETRSAGARPPPDETRSAGARPPLQVAATEAKRRVLIIDAEEPLAGSFARILEGDHEVTALSSAQEALRRIESGESWDVILCDLRIGELDGMEFHERLNRARPDLAARLGFITEGPWPPEVRTFLACNTWPTIEKPVDAEGVRAVLARMALQ